MDNIIIYTDYFVHGVKELLEKAQLSVGLYVYCSYEEVHKALKELPNLLGVLIIEYKPKKSIKKNLKNIIQSLEKISKAKEEPLTLSMIYKKDTVVKILKEFSTENIYITATKFMRLTEETIRLDGIVPIMFYSKGIFYRQPKGNFILSNWEVEKLQEKLFIDVVSRMIDMDIPQIILDKLSLMEPNIIKIHTLRQNDSFWEEIKALYKGTYKLKLIQAVRDERDRRKNENSI